MMANKAHIDELYTDAGAFDKGAATQALKPFVAIQRGTHEIYLRSGPQLPVDAKILVYALAKKLLAIEKRIETEHVSAIEVHKATGIKKGSVDAAFKKLRDDGIWVGSGGAYEIPHYNVGKVVERLEALTKK